MSSTSFGRHSVINLFTRASMSGIKYASPPSLLIRSTTNSGFSLSFRSILSGANRPAIITLFAGAKLFGSRSSKTFLLQVAERGSKTAHMRCSGYAS